MNELKGPECIQSVNLPGEAAPLRPSKLRILVAVCTFNEAENIHCMLVSLREHVPDAQLLVVDDDSPDGTAAIVDRFAHSDPATELIVRKGQRGLGGAIKRAIETAIKGDYEMFVNLDGDFSHHPAQIPRLISAASRPVANRSPSDDIRYPDVVVGSRYTPGGAVVGWPWRRRLMSRMVNRFATLCLRLPVSDCSGSMRCYRVNALKRIDSNDLRSEGYALLEELLFALSRSGATFAEVPITFTDRTHGSSKLTFREAIRSASQIIKLAFRA